MLYHELYLEILLLNSLVTYDGVNLSFGFSSTIDKNKQLDSIEKEKIGNILYNKVNPFNGTLISKELVEKIGYPRKEFFCGRDETDYLKRSEKVGATIATILNSVYYHPESKSKFKKIFGYSTQIYEKKQFDKEYYFRLGLAQDSKLFKAGLDELSNFVDEHLISC